MTKMKKRTITILLLGTLLLAHVGRADDKPCCNPTPDPATQACCDGTTYDKTEHESSVTLDLTAIIDALNTAEKTLKAVPKNGNSCEWAKKPKVDADVSLKKYDECCDKDGTKTVKHSVDASISAKFDLADLTCTVNLLSTDVPEWLASFDISLGGSASVGFDKKVVSNSCKDSGKNCVDLDGIKVSLTASATLAVGKTYVGDYVLASADVKGTGSMAVTVQACMNPDDGTLSLKNPAAKPSLTASAEYTYLGNKNTFTLPIYKSE